MSKQQKAICPECGSECKQGVSERKIQCSPDPDDFIYEGIHWVDCTFCSWGARDCEGENYDIAFDLAKEAKIAK